MDLKNRYTNFDLLRIPISLSYKSEYFYRTTIGATLSIVGFFVVIIYFIIKLIALIKKSSFTVITNEFQSPNESINFTNTPFLFSLTDSDGNPLELNSKIFDFSVVFSNYEQNFDQYGNSNIKHIEKEIEIDRCDNINSYLEHPSFKNSNLSSFKCIKPQQDLTIDGVFAGVNGYKSFKVNLKKCNNLTHNCYDSDYIDSIISNSRLVVIYIGYKTNFYSSSNNDLEEIIYSRSVPLSSFFNKRVFLYMSVVKYKLYDNLFLNYKKEKIYFINKDMRIEYRPIHDINVNDTFYNNVYGFFAFVYDGNVIEYTKRVEKFGDIISYIGNFFNIILTLFRIINNYFSNKILFIDIFSNFFIEKRVENKKKVAHLDNSSLFVLCKNKINQLKLNSKTQEKSINNNIKSNFNFNSSVGDKIIENNQKIVNKNTLKNDKNKIGIKSILSIKPKKISKKKNINFLRKLRVYYLCPLCFIKNKKNSNNIHSINKRICNTFSLENYFDFLKISKNLNKIKNEKLTDFNYEHKSNKGNYTDNKCREQINIIFNK